MVAMTDPEHVVDAHIAEVEDWTTDILANVYLAAWMADTEPGAQRIVDTFYDQAHAYLIANLTPYEIRRALVYALMPAAEKKAREVVADMPFPGPEDPTDFVDRK